MRNARRRRWVPLALAASVLSLLPGSAAAQHGTLHGTGDDPYRYDVRTALFPVAFVAGMTQRSFGSALRAELDLGRRLTLELGGVVPWLVVGGEEATGTFTASAGVSIHLVDRVELEPLEGTVHPKDYAAPTGNVGADTDSTVPVSARLGGPELRAPEHASSDAEGPVRQTHSLRAGYHLGRTVQRARPDNALGTSRFATNTVHALYLGYGFGQAWNLSPATVGERELGYRRFYLDALLTLDPLVDADVIEQQLDPALDPGLEGPQPEPSLMPLGMRLGMQGAIDALIRSAPGLGFAYTVELSMLPGRSGLEGRLLIALGIELDASTSPARAR